MALKAAANFSPDLILLDIIMPGMDGYETCEVIKSNPATENIPVIFLSAKADLDDIVKGFQAGGVDYIAKPFNHEEVFVRIRTQLLLREKTKKLEEAKMKNINFAKELQRSNEALTDFASIAAHDLKAPLRGICYQSQYLMEDYGEKLEGQGKGYIEKIKIMSEDLSKLIDSLFNYSIITKNAKQFETNDLKNLIQKVVDSLEIQVQESKGEIKINDLPTIEGEPYLLAQLFQNLISNALKFHADGTLPSVEIYSESLEKGNWAIFIKDNGIGIDEEFLEEIFSPFKRLVAESEFEGSGMGLATCKKIVDFHKGSILASSNGTNGSTFKVIIPEKQI